MKINEAFPGMYLVAADLKDREVKVQINQVREGEVGGEMKPVMYFVGKEKGLVMNKTNWNTVTEIAGTDESDEWTGQDVILFATETEFQGKRVPCLRLKADKKVGAPPKAPKVKPSTQAAEQFESETPPEDIPF